MPRTPEPRIVDPAPDSELLTVQEYAAMMRVHVQSVYTAINAGRLRYPVIRPTGDSIRIAVPRETILALANTNRR